jgi:SAM-dependent methyltransferase
VPIKLLSLAGFYLSCLQAYFRPGYRWNLATPLSFFSRAAIYFCNWCYFFFLNSTEFINLITRPKLLKIESDLAKAYLYPSQFWIALTEGVKITGPETLYRLTYGETSLFGIAASLKAVGATSQDIFYDLGCGTGRNVFFAHATYGMKAVGIDLIEPFVRHAQQIVEKQELQQLEFRHQNIFEIDLSEATIVYVTANCLDQEWLSRLVQRLQDLPLGAWVISTARPIPSPELKLLFKQKQFFSWGLDTVYMHQKVAV